MKSFLLATFLMLIGSPLFSQVIFGSGNVTETVRNFEGINAIEIKGHFRVSLIQGDKEEVRIKTDDNFHEYILTDFKDGKLTIYVKKGKYKKVTAKDITISFKSLESIANTGSGDIKCDNQFSGGTLQVTQTGSGDIDLNVSVSELNVELTGSGDIDLLGNTNKLNIKQFGSGDIKAFNLQAQDVTLEKSGSGNTQIYANGTLTGSMNGSGDVMHKGGAVSAINNSGTGEILKE